MGESFGRLGASDGAPTDPRQRIDDLNAQVASRVAQQSQPPPAGRVDGADGPAREPVQRRVSDVPPELVERLSRRWRSEGPGAPATRASVWLKHLTYLVVTLLCVAVVHAAYSVDPALRVGGYLLLTSMTIMYATAAVGTLVHADSRDEIADLLRRFAFSYVLFPATGIAVLFWALHQLDVANEGDMLYRLVYEGLTWLFVLDVFFPMAIFIKSVVGFRTLKKSKMDPEEEMGLWTRQDGLQR